MVYIKMVMTDKFCVTVAGLWDTPWPAYFDKFWKHCMEVASANDWAPITVANHELKPLGGKLITTSTQGWYLRWDDEANHTFFVLKWS
jgi:hypothetical protein